MRRLFFVMITMFFSLTVFGQNDSLHFITSDSVKLYIRIAGKGDPCVFIHGGPGATSYYFEALPVARLLEEHLEMIYFDQRGSGRSASSADSNYSMGRMEKDIDELRNFLKIKKWSVIGHSFGGLIMTAYARDYPENIQSLIYVHCTLDLNSALQSHIENGLTLLRLAGDNYPLDKKMSTTDQMNAVHTELPNNKIEYEIMFRSQAEKTTNDSLMKTATSHFNQDFSHWVWSPKGHMDYLTNYTGYANDIRCPVLIIAGKKYYAVGPENYRSWHFTNQQVVLYEGGHFSFQEEPSWFARTVLEFLKKD